MLEGQRSADAASGTPTVPASTEGTQAGASEGQACQAQQPRLSEQIHWAALGIGCTWFLGDSTNLEIPWWVESQDDGIRVGDRVAFAGTFAPLCVPLMLLFRTCFRKQFMETVVPAAIVLSMAAGYMLGFGLWNVSSSFIYASVLLSQMVGTMVPFGMLSHMIYKNYKPALVSSLYLGGSLASLSASSLSMVQSPGDQRRFSPSIFFLVVTTPILASLLAYWRISSRSVGALPTLNGPPDVEIESQSHTLIPSAERRDGSRYWKRGLGRQLASVVPLAITSSLMTLGSFNVLRSALPFATTNTVHGHSLCHPRCSDVCAELTSLGRDACDSHGACESQIEEITQSFRCVENRGEKWLGWSVSLAQFSFAFGIGATVVFPCFRIYFCALAWLLPMSVVLSMARAGSGSFETDWSGPAIVLCVFLARMCQGYFEVMQWRYIAYRYRECQEIVTTFVGAFLLIGNFAGGLLTAFLIEDLHMFED